MAQKPKLISEQLREAMFSDESVSRYRLAKEIGVTEALLSRFKHGTSGLGQETIDKIGEFLGLELTKRKSKSKTKPKKGK